MGFFLVFVYLSKARSRLYQHRSLQVINSFHLNSGFVCGGRGEVSFVDDARFRIVSCVLDMSHMRDPVPLFEVTVSEVIRRENVCVHVVS